MNIARLRQINARFQELAKSLDAELAAPESAKDPLSVHIYHARRSYRQAVENDTSKAGRQVQTTLDLSFKEARKLGFQGGSRKWFSRKWFLVMMSAAPS